MRKNLLALGMIVLIGSPALAGKNAGGAMVVNTRPTHQYTGTLNYCPGGGGYVEPATCEEAITQNDVSEAYPGVVWFLAAFHETSNPGVTVCYFGDAHNIPPNQGYFVAWSFCGPANTLEVPDTGWPQFPATAGNSVAFGSPIVGDRLFPFYWFGVYGFTGAYLGTAINPTGGYAAFVSDDNPGVLDYCYKFGHVSWYVPGANDCPEAPQLRGACCFEDGHCEELSPEECAAGGGDYQGDDTVCEQVECPQPLGACCDPDGSCRETTEADCFDDWLGPGTVCDPNPCPQPIGACCAPDGTCTMTTEEDCDGEWFGMDATCEPDNPCPQPIGACCAPDGTCTMTTEEDCDGEWQGMDTNCSPNLCTEEGLSFIRGDTNADGDLNIRDTYYYMIARRMPDPPCWDAADFDDSGDVALPDLIGLLQYIFGGGTPPPPPFPECGPDPTEDELACASFPPCEPGKEVHPIGLSPKAAEPGEVAIDLLPRFSIDGSTLLAPVELDARADLAAFEFTVDYDPALLHFVALDSKGLAGERMTFLSARDEYGVGRLRVGAVPRFDVANRREHGKSIVSNLVFEILDSSRIENGLITVNDGILLSLDGHSVQVAPFSCPVSDSGSRPARDPSSMITLILQNPMRPYSLVLLDLPDGGFASVAIYNIRGQKLRTLINGELSAGRHEIVWDGRTDSGQTVMAGIYHLRARSGGREIDRKITLIR